jgi:hypothetical protein
MEMASFSKLLGAVLMSGLILFDGTPAYRSPGEKSPVAIYDTGQRVEIVQSAGARRAGTGGSERFYEIKRGGGTVWVPARAVRVSTKEDSGADFGTLHLDFYRRAARNKDAGARALGARGLVLGLKGRERLEAWMDFQRDEADEVRCAANESFGVRVVEEGPPADPRFNDALGDALIRVRREGGWGEEALCGLGRVLARSAHPDKTALKILLSERSLGRRPERPRPRDVSRARELLRMGLSHPDGWVRRNTISQVCEESVSTDTVLALSERFQSMTPDDKMEVIEDDFYFRSFASARPLMLRIAALVGDKSQPAKLRRAALADDGVPRAEKRPAVRATLGDPEDSARLEFARGDCQYRDVLEESANSGDAAAFAAALGCLDSHAGKLGGREFHERLAEWSTPSLAANLQEVSDTGRRAQLDSRLKCLLGQALCPVSLSVDSESN